MQLREPDWAALFACVTREEDGFLAYLSQWFGCREVALLWDSPLASGVQRGEAVSCGRDLFFCVSVRCSTARGLLFRFSDTATAPQLGFWLQHACSANVRSLLLQACDLFITLQEGQQFQRAALAFLERLPLPLIIFDASCKPVFSNRKAVSLSQESDDFHLTSGSVRLSREKENGHLQKLLREKATREMIRLENHDQLFLLTLSNTRVPALLTTNRWCDVGTPQAMSRFLVWMYLLPGGDSTELDSVELRRDFGLTRAEAELANYLFGGGCLKAFARNRGVSEATARTQLRSVLRKSGSDSQEALIVALFHRRLNALSAWPGVRLVSPEPLSPAGEAGHVATNRH